MDTNDIGKAYSDGYIRYVKEWCDNARTDQT